MFILHPSERLDVPHAHWISWQLVKCRHLVYIADAALYNPKVTSIKNESVSDPTIDESCLIKAYSCRHLMFVSGKAS